MANATYDMVMSGKSDSNIRFTDFRNLLLSYGFRERIRGDHYIYKRDDIAERINIQPNGNKAKAYQVKQVRMLFEKYKL
ncbi:MAG: type II toxin-antitoxin system HicA family toxin [Lachnospiraceae bacterium]|nr:type II toxin-antitoxin system HicA family toxin [Lachnospiraceae bacterium]